MRRRWRDTLTDNLSYKIVSLFIALILWLTILGRRDFSLTKTIDLELMTGPNKVVVTQNVEIAKVKVSGPRTALKKFMDSGLSQLLIIDISDSMVANGYFVGVSAQIFYYRFCVTKRFFGKNYPRFFP